MSTILVVEDDSKISLAMSMRLKSVGYNVVTAQDVPSALMVARKEEPDLALLDISIPGGDGFVVAERLRDKILVKHVPIVFITASKQDGLREKAKKLGAAAFLEKPFKASQLLQAIDDAMIFGGSMSTIAPA
jgi:CheY-like chemotaxis protein